MASEKNLKLKKDLVSEINSKVENASTVLLVDYQGMTVSELNDLRQSLKNAGSDLKVYKKVPSINIGSLVVNFEGETLEA